MKTDTTTPITTMDGDEYRAAIERLNLSLVDAAGFLDVDNTTSRRWAADRSPMPLATAMLLAVMLRYNLTPRSVEALMRKRASA